MMEQRDRVRSLLYASLKYAWTNSVDSTTIPDDATNLDDDTPLVATSAIHMSYEDEEDEEVDLDHEAILVCV